MTLVIPAYLTIIALRSEQAPYTTWVRDSPSRTNAITANELPKGANEDGRVPVTLA